MGEFIKSYSNYVLKRKHQNIDSGSIYERDITTIGGLNQFAKGQVPIYKSSNFIITVNNETKAQRNFLNEGWEKNGSEEVWTLNDISNTSDVESAEKTLKIVLKQDYYKLKDFAYFGSCVELIRASIIDIVTRYPGELYVPEIQGSGIPVYYTEVGNNEPIRLGGNDLVLVDNPHNIDIHTKEMCAFEIKDSLKYMCNDGYKNYTSSDLTDSGCTWSVTIDNTCKDINGTKQLLLATIVINGITIYAYKCNLGIFYLTSNSNKGKIITRPNKKNIDEFFDSLDNFQKILMNRESKPEYSAVFEVISENSFGYITELRTFTFPKTYGSYNLAVDNAAYNSYINDLMKYAEFYDEYFCDNIWRSMTHESIKNFDWTYTREYGIGEEEEYVFGGTRMQKTLRLIGREFDEIKTYIDALKNYQKVDYGKNNALPDYFLTDVVNDEGWDVTNIYPYNDNLKQIQKGIVIKPYSTDYICNTQKNGYFYKCENCNGRPSLIAASGNKQEIYDECIGAIRPKIKQYSSENEVSMTDINNHFLKMLKLNSKSIFRKKGTIQGIESLLALFGLKSKRWCDKYNNYYKQDSCITDYTADYEVIEYVTASNYITDIWKSDYRKMNEYDWYNYTKTVAYDTSDYLNGIYHSYQGLPVRAYVNEGGKYYQIDRIPYGTSLENKSKYLFPYFSPNKIIDGNPYYQMNGGWLNRTPKVFDKDNTIVNATNNVKLFKETYRNIRNVNNVRDLLKIPKTSLHDNDLCYVDDLSGNFVIADGHICDIFTDDKGTYIKTNIINNTAKVGDKVFGSELTVSMPDNTIMKYVFSEYQENTEIRIYVNSNKRIIVYGKYYAINNIQFYSNGNVTDTYSPTTSVANNAMHYFKLKNVNNKTELSAYGWSLLETSSDEFKRINTVVDRFKGNNPHTGHMNYDGGKEYISYFTQLFKYALEDNQFNEKCYGNDFFETMETLSNWGFSDLEDNSYVYCYPEYQDTKIHYLGDILNKNGVKTKYNNSLLKSEHPNVRQTLLTTDITDHIMNIKRVDINFFGTKNNTIIKYFDSVVMNYLEQILPSTLIINVNYCK